MKTLTRRILKYQGHEIELVRTRIGNPMVRVYAPTGRVWNVNGEHSIEILTLGDLAGAMASIILDIEQGFSTCEEKHCDWCAPTEMDEV